MVAEVGFFDSCNKFGHAYVKTSSDFHKICETDVFLTPFYMPYVCWIQFCVIGKLFLSQATINAPVADYLAEPFMYVSHVCSDIIVELK